MATNSSANIPMPTGELKPKGEGEIAAENLIDKVVTGVKDVGSKLAHGEFSAAGHEVGGALSVTAQGAFAGVKDFASGAAGAPAALFADLKAATGLGGESTPVEPAEPVQPAAPVE